MTLPIGSIDFQDVSKTYQIIQRASPRMGAWFLSKAFEHFRRAPFHALNGVSFHIAPGEMVGFVGSNGAGKSTILKLIAGITQPTRGRVQVSGPVTSLLELGVGFHPDLTGMENIFYHGIMMGMTRAGILKRLEEIIAFSGLAEFLYEPVKHYSSGMYSRLATSVALHLEPRIILVDEILAVGDAEFQQRGVLKILEQHERGVTVILVTHETATARDLCDRLIWIEQGQLNADGDPKQVAADYSSFMMARAESEGELVPGHERPSGECHIERVRFFSGETETDSIETGQPARIEIELAGDVASARVALRWKWTDGRRLNEDLSEAVAFENGRARLVYRIPRWPLLAARIRVAVSVYTDDRAAMLDHDPDALMIHVETPGWTIGETLVGPKVAWSVEKHGG